MLLYLILRLFVFDQIWTFPVLLDIMFDIGPQNFLCVLKGGHLKQSKVARVPPPLSRHENSPVFLSYPQHK